jgi:hypothetical protein
MQNNINYKRYIIALILSSMVFASGFLVSNLLTSNKLDSLKTIEDNISLTILSAETEYDILREIPCDTPNSIKNTTLNKEISELAEKLQILETNDQNDERIIAAKKRYTLLLVKDYLLSKKVSESCKIKPTFVIYFYGNADICPECVRTSTALSSLRSDYENLRVYAFDMNLDLPLIKSFAGIYGIKNESLPALVIDKKVYGGLNTKEAIEQLLPKEIKIQNPTTTKKSSLLNTINNFTN